MNRRLVIAALVALQAAGAGAAPRVVADIAPVHSLSAMVMAGVGAPTLLASGGVSPHDAALRPSQAQALSEADLVVWIGPELTPWLAGAVESLAPQAERLGLLGAPGAVRLEHREGARFAAHADHDEGMAADHDHDAGHDHGAIDPHAWLDPLNAQLWLGEIAGALQRLDPANAPVYAANAAAARAEIAALVDEIDAALAPARGRPFVVTHDAYHYFEARFDIEATGAIALSDASAPGPRRLAEIRDAIARSGARCVFAEPQIDSRLATAAIADAGARLATLDPLGAALNPGPGLYAALLRDLSGSLVDCLAG